MIGSVCPVSMVVLLHEFIGRANDRRLVASLAARSLDPRARGGTPDVAEIPRQQVVNSVGGSDAYVGRIRRCCAGNAPSASSLRVRAASSSVVSRRVTASSAVTRARAACVSPSAASVSTSSEATRRNRSDASRHHSRVMVCCAAMMRSRDGRAVRWLTMEVPRRRWASSCSGARKVIPRARGECTRRHRQCRRDPARDLHQVQHFLGRQRTFQDPTFTAGQPLLERWVAAELVRSDGSRDVAPEPFSFR